MDRPIVVGTDGSVSATKALVEAMRLAKALDEPLHIVSAYRKTAFRVDVPSEFVGSVNSLDHVESVLADAGCRARSAGLDVSALAALPGGRVASGDAFGFLQLWE